MIAPDSWIRTMEVGFPLVEEINNSKPIMVFIHGYGGSSALFFELMKPLSVHFHAIFIDIIGMGGSSRSDYTVTTSSEAVEYFMDFLEKWRSARSITGFNLVAHSFGGYLAGLYNVRYP